MNGLWMLIFCKHRILGAEGEFNVHAASKNIDVNLNTMENLIHLSHLAGLQAR